MSTPGFIPDPPKLCPTGHKEGTRFGTHRCTTKRCGEITKRENDLGVRKGALDLDALAKENPAELAHLQRMQLSGVPKRLKPEEARQWASDKLQEYLPLAVANIHWDLKYGTDKQRSEAVDRVLKANGMDRREGSAAAPSSMIVLNIGNGQGMKIPWLERTKPSQPVVEELAEKDDDQ